MLSINKVMVTGRLTRDPETKYLPSGAAVTTLSVAVNRRFQDKNGEWRDETTFIDVETWGKTAERAAETLRKGRPVYVDGRLKQDTWEKDGQKQSKIRIVAERVTGFDVPQRAGGGEEGGDAGDSAPASGPARSGGSRPAARQSGGASPSDGLDFQDSNVQDDIPF
ncbi:MAG: single-stranded DNA-binding protein [Candidatus Sumerlaeaceae bacterium]|nr:single-stranded DNA-binding protein [Candidatus Sumerlaeaceae bacterium]